MSICSSRDTGHTEVMRGFYHLCRWRAARKRQFSDISLGPRHKSIMQRFMNRIADYLNSKYGIGTVELTIEDSYYNMREKIEPRCI